MASGGKDGSVWIWVWGEEKKKKDFVKFRHQQGEVYCVRFLFGGGEKVETRVASGGEDGLIYIWGVEKKILLKKLD